MSKQPAALLAYVRSLLFTVALASSCNSTTQWKGTAFTPPRDVSMFTFTDSAGRSVPIAPEKGGATLVFFGYTNCPDVCSATLNDWVRVKKALGEKAGHVHFVFVTVDPNRDTPAVAQRYVAQFDSAFRGVSADSMQTVRMEKAFGVAATVMAPVASHGYLMAHSSQSFLLNDRGALIVMFAFASGWDTIAADVRQLLD